MREALRSQDRELPLRGILSPITLFVSMQGIETATTLTKPSMGQVKLTANNFRKEIKQIAEALNNFKQSLLPLDPPATPKENPGEAMANLTLAYRHLEDASMRLGKAVQATDGGESVYDKETTVGA